jgi:hypothetical protein
MSIENICTNCGKNFSTKSSLNVHRRTSKSCATSERQYFQCEFCQKELTSLYNLNKHIEKCIIKKIVLKEYEKFERQINEKDNNILHLNNQGEEQRKIITQCERQINEKNNHIEEQNKIITQYEEQNKIIQQYEKQIIQKDDTIAHLKSLMEQKDIQTEKHEASLQAQIKELQDKLERIATKSIDKPTTVNTVMTTNTLQLNNFMSQESINQKVREKFDTNYLVKSVKGVAQFVFDHIIQEDGKIFYRCYDVARQIFKYRDEEGNEIKDPKAVKLLKLIKPEIEKKTGEIWNTAIAITDRINSISSFNRSEQDIRDLAFNNFIINSMVDRISTDISEMDNGKFSCELAKLSS